MISINLKDFDKLKRLSPVFERKLQKLIPKMVRLLTLSVERESKESITELQAVDTGRARASIYSLFRANDVGVVQPNVTYDIYIHEGLGSHRAYGRRPFMEMGAERTVEKQEDKIIKMMDNMIGGLTLEIN